MNYREVTYFMSNFFKIFDRKAKRTGKIKVINEKKVSYFREAQNSELKKIAPMFSGKMIINLGAFSGDPDKEGSIYETYFDTKNFYTLDLKSDIDKDNSKHFVCDLLDLSSIKMKFELALIMSVLEHVKDPFKVVEEIKNILKPNGYVYVTVPFFYPEHPGGNQLDYWRFTLSGLKMLFRDFNLISSTIIKSSIVSVSDRPRYWFPENTYAGICAFFKIKKRKSTFRIK